jgi:hypothetical protein
MAEGLSGRHGCRYRGRRHTTREGSACGTRDVPQPCTTVSNNANKEGGGVYKAMDNGQYGGTATEVIHAVPYKEVDV